MESKKTIRGFSPTRSEPQTQESILVVDDDVRVIELLQITLSGRGYKVHTAFDGDAGLEELGRTKPDLLVLDVRLPRKSGFQVLDAVRADPATARLPVILISGNPSSEARIQGLRMGADDYLIKPFSPRELIMKIRRILDRVADQKLLRRQNELLADEVRDQRQQMLQAQTEMTRNLLKIGTILQRVDQLHDRRSLQEVFEGFVQAMVVDVNLEQVCFFFRDRENNRFRPEIWRGAAEQAMLNLTLPVDGLLCEMVALEGRTLILDELVGYPRATEDLIRLTTAGFTHLTPVRLEGEVVALIAGGEKSGRQQIDRLDIELLAVLARSAATAIQNAAAFDQVRRSFVDTTAQLVATVESRYPNLAGHSARVHDMVLGIAETLGLSAAAKQTVSYAALLHDLGALEEYELLYEEHRLLTDAERAALRERTSDGVRAMLEHSQMPEVADALYHLNEYWDGRGVPDGLTGDSIPLAARIVAVANAFDALTHGRPHRLTYSAEDAILIIRDRAGHQFDPEIIAAFLRVVERRPDLARPALEPGS